MIDIEREIPLNALHKTVFTIIEKDMDVTLNVKTVKATGTNYRSTEVELEGVDKSELMDNLTIQDFIDHFNVNKILDTIGENECKEYFDLINNDE